MKEKNLFQLDELGNRLYTRVFQTDEGSNIQANIYLNKVGSRDMKFLGNYYFLESRLVLEEKSKIRIFDGMYIPIDDCIFQHLPFEIHRIGLKIESHYYEVTRSVLDQECVYADVKNNNFTCIKYLPSKLLKSYKSTIF